MRKDPIIEAAHAHSTLNVFGAVVALLEGGLIYDGSGTGARTAAKIIAICNAEGQRQLKRYDKAVEAAKSKST